MNAKEALEYLKLHVQFIEDASGYVQIVDVDPAGEVELKTWNRKGESKQRWLDFQTAAEVIAEHSD